MSLFGQAVVDAAIKESEDFKASLDKEIIPLGLNMLVIEKVDIEFSKNNEPMFTIEYAKAKDREKYKTFKDYFFFGANAAMDKQGHNISAKKIVAFFKDAFGYSIKPTHAEDTVEALNEILGQVKQFEETRFRAVVKHEKRLNQRLVEFLAPAIAFCGLHSDENINEKSYDAAKLLIPLSEYDRQRLAGTATSKKSSGAAGGGAAKTAAGAATGSPNIGAPPVNDDDDLPF